MIVVEFLDAEGNSPFGAWFDELDARAAAKVAVALARIEQGNLSNVKAVGSGVHEYHIDFGPGYRLHLGRDGDALVILLAGGTKRLQQADIASAHTRWAEYKRRRRQRE